VGGTFIDVIGVDEATGEFHTEKQPATPDHLADELFRAIDRLPGGVGAVSELLHGSTVAINALLQSRGARVGLITTAGFRDVLELGRGNRPYIYDWVWNPSQPLVPRNLRREVGERIGPHGEELSALLLDDVDHQTDALIADGVEAIAICFLHAYANPDHERAAAARIAVRYPDVPVTTSCEVAAEWREFERTSTAVVNAHLQPVLGSYIADVAERLGHSGATLSIMASNGGLMAADRAAALPVRTLASGPAGGVIGCSSLARSLGYRDVICADVGGTTFDVSIIERGEIQERTLTDVDGRPILGASVDVVSVGAGGGSIAWIDDTGGLRVGPVSAGARPGPACFGLGGTEPTVTDAHVILGLLDPQAFLGSRMPLQPDAAEGAIRTRIADPLGMDVVNAAAGIVTIAQSAMAAAIHAMTVERGSDPRGLAMFAVPRPSPRGGSQGRRTGRTRP
jgi:N-methylhydantoinase A